MGRLADARDVTKWPPSRDLSMPVGLIKQKIALMDINLMLIDIYLHNFTPNRCSYELLKLGIFTFLFKASYLILLRLKLTVIRHCAVVLNKLELPNTHNYYKNNVMEVYDIGRKLITIDVVVVNLFI